jgi:hypothetical protein
MNSTETKSEYPKTWSWDEDGEHLEGTFVEFGEGPTANGLQPLVVLEVDGERRSLWLFHEALRSKFRSELERRPDQDLNVGEPLIVRRREWKESAVGRKYRDYFVAFPEAPRRSAAEILGLDAGAQDDGEGVEDDSIPF